MLKISTQAKVVSNLAPSNICFRCNKSAKVHCKKCWQY